MLLLGSQRRGGGERGTGVDQTVVEVAWSQGRRVVEEEEWAPHDGGGGAEKRTAVGGGSGEGFT
jgi:hypothetical protein